MNCRAALLVKTCREENHRPFLFFLKAKLATVVLLQKTYFYYLLDTLATGMLKTHRQSRWRDTAIWSLPSSSESGCSLLQSVYSTTQLEFVIQCSDWLYSHTSNPGVNKYACWFKQTQSNKWLNVLHIAEIHVCLFDFLYQNTFSNNKVNYKLSYAKFTHPDPENIPHVLELYFVYDKCCGNINSVLLFPGLAGG